MIYRYIIYIYILYIYIYLCHLVWADQKAPLGLYIVLIPARKYYLREKPQAAQVATVHCDNVLVNGRVRGAGQVLVRLP